MKLDRRWKVRAIVLDQIGQSSRGWDPDFPGEQDGALLYFAAGPTTPCDGESEDEYFVQWQLECSYCVYRPKILVHNFADAGWRPYECLWCGTFTAPHQAPPIPLHNGWVR